MRRRSDDRRVKMQDIQTRSLDIDVALGRKTTAFVVAADDGSLEVKTAVR